MSIIGIIIVLVVVGFLLWLVNRLIPMDPTIQKVLIAVVVLVVVLWLLQQFGVLGPVQSVRIK